MIKIASVGKTLSNDSSPMKIFVTFSNETYLSARRLNIWTAKNIAGFDKVFSLSPSDIEDDFVKKNSRILSYSKGSGLWLWKPWAVKYALDRANVGDYVFYDDAACFWIRKVDNIIKKMDQDVWICDISLLEEQFTKPSLFRYMECDTDEYKKTRQRPAVYLGLRKSALSVKIVNEWLDYCQKEDCISPETEMDIEEGMGVGFISHREDQSILSLLTKKYHINAHHNPSLSGLHPEYERFNNAIYVPTSHKKEYPICVVHHRKPKINAIMLLRKMIEIVLPNCFVFFFRTLRK